MKKFIKQAPLIIGLALTLQGCIFVAGAAAGAAAIAVVYDHRTIANALNDTQIANNIVNKIREVASLRDESHIEVTVFNHVVLLTGQTPNPACRFCAKLRTRGGRNIGSGIASGGPIKSR